MKREGKMVEVTTKVKIDQQVRIGFFHKTTFKFRYLKNKQWFDEAVEKYGEPYSIFIHTNGDVTAMYQK